MDDFQSKQLTNPRNGRRTYLATYSQGDLNKFPTRQSFGKMLEEQFNAGYGRAKVSHLDLSAVGSPKTKNSTKAYRESRKRARELDEEIVANPCKQKVPNSTHPKRLTNVQVSEFLVKHSIKRDIELLAVAKERKDEGQMDLANFVLSKSSKVLNELIDKTWKMETANENIQRETKSRMEILREKLGEDCCPGCDKLWLKCAMEVLRNN